MSINLDFKKIFHKKIILILEKYKNNKIDYKIYISKERFCIFFSGPKNNDLIYDLLYNEKIKNNFQEKELNEIMNLENFFPEFYGKRYKNWKTSQGGNYYYGWQLIRLFLLGLDKDFKLYFFDASKGNFTKEELNHQKIEDLLNIEKQELKNFLKTTTNECRVLSLLKRASDFFSLTTSSYFLFKNFSPVNIDGLKNFINKSSENILNLFLLKKINFDISDINNVQIDFTNENILKVDKKPLKYKEFLENKIRKDRLFFSLFKRRMNDRF